MCLGGGFIDGTNVDSITVINCNSHVSTEGGKNIQAVDVRALTIRYCEITGTGIGALVTATRANAFSAMVNMRGCVIHSGAQQTNQALDFSCSAAIVDSNMFYARDGMNSTCPSLVATSNVLGTGH